MKWFLIVVLICISLMINDAQHLWICFLIICISFLEKCPFRPLAHVLTGLFVFLWLGFKSFPDSSVGKESTCNAGDPGLVPGSGRSAEEQIGYPLRYSWTSLVAQLVKNLPAVWETWVRSLGWEDPLKKVKATHSRILAWRIPWTTLSMGSQRVRHDWVTFTFTFSLCILNTDPLYVLQFCEFSFHFFFLFTFLIMSFEVSKFSILM